jgi:hypothetical protein
MSNKVFIGKDFIESQYLWLIPIVDGFCKSLKIKTIVLEKKIPDSVYSLSVIRNILNNYDLIVVEDNFSLWRKCNLKYIVIFFTKFFLIFNFFFRIRSDYLLNTKKNYRLIQIIHGIWDYINYNLNEKTLKKNFYIKIQSVILSVYKLDLINYIFNKYSNIKYAFLGHSVYQSRIALAELRSLGVKVISQASFNLHFQKNNKDYYENNKDKIKDYYENNKDKIKDYQEKNKDKIQKIKKEYYENNKDKINTRYICDICNGNYTYANRVKHFNTQKHQSELNNLLFLINFY